MDMTVAHHAAKDTATAGARIARSLVLLGALLVLAACADGSKATPTPVAAPAAAPIAEPAKPPERLTATQINEKCWMKYEASRADLDKRMKLVEKCVDERTKAQQGM